MKKSSNVSRNLPKVNNTGNPQLNNWMNAATEIIQELRQNIAILQKNSSGSGTGSSTQSVIKTPDLSDYERTDNKVLAIDDQQSIRTQYPSVLAVIEYVNSVLGSNTDERNIFDTWDIASQTFADIDAHNGDKFRIVGNGTYNSITLRDGDIVEIYDDEDEELKLFVLVDSRTLLKGVHTTDDLDEGVLHLYFTSLRVLETTLADLLESEDEIEATDSILVALGKAKGRINHLQEAISFLEFTLEQQITDINLDLDAIHLQLNGIVTDIGNINTSIGGLQTAINGNTASINDLNADVEILQTDMEEAQYAIEGLETAMPDKLNIADLMDALKDTVPSTTGAYILKSIDGVVSWELQP